MHKLWAHHHVSESDYSPEVMQRCLKQSFTFRFHFCGLVLQVNVRSLSHHEKRV